MKFSQMASLRESCRNFKTDSIPKEHLISIIETARISPSACNSQPWHLTLAMGESARRVASCTQELGMNRFTDNCPAFIVINEKPATLSAKIGGAVKNQQYAQMDIGIIASHICYAAQDYGVSTCILGWFNEDKLREVIGIQKDCRIRLIIALGYANYDELRTKKRKELSDILTVIE